MFKREQFKNFRFSLTLKIALALMTIIIIVMGINTFLDIKETKSKMEEYENKNNFSIFTGALPIIENAVWQVEFKDLRSTLSQIMKNQNIVSVAVFTEKEKNIAFLERGLDNQIKKISLENLISNFDKKILSEMDPDKKNIRILEIIDSKNERKILAYPLIIKNTYNKITENIKVGYFILVCSTHSISIATKEIIYKSISLSFFLGFVIVISSFLFIKILIINPIKSLEKTSIEISKNNLIQTKIPKSLIGHDEMESLSKNFNHMVTQIIKLIEDEKEQQRMANELETAKLIQKSFIPSAKNLKVGHFEISGFFQSASECGGDWWHFYPLIDKKILIMLGDVTGHGTPSALLTAAVKGYCDSIYSRQKVNPALVLEELDVIVRNSGGGDELLMTMFVAVIDPLQHKMTYANAAQNFPFVVSEDSNTTSPTTLLGTGKRLGYKEQENNKTSVPYKNFSIDFKVNDLLFLYSDGLTDAKNTSKRDYSERRLKKKLKELHPKLTYEIISEIKNDLFEFTNGSHFEDDVTFVACRFCENENFEYTNELIQYFTHNHSELEETLIQKAS
ncbi:SpoIIE family protein phosphatase [Silvanigrella aquatica]|uniref:HAMP domain-containing protein n=1 Tax=Silvanigrella aquatica TaxID=1915309 RepID=A0A1L4CYK8_9BACT|nr:SpoIIE family protein phosphatase [Silvanigrella aquatica]APJ03015.1 hypothetical protein AXG55_03425 [Silvanigrella aquatica]